MRLAALTLLSLCTLALLSSCDEDKDGETTATTTTTTTTTTSTSTTDDNSCSSDSDCDSDYTCSGGSCVYDPSVWVIGEGGTVLRVSSLGKVSPHDFAADADLRAITCHGSEDAWVVGDQGFAARTADGGETWESLDLGVNVDLMAVQATENHRVWISGAGGTIIHSDLQGQAPLAVAGADGALRGLGVSGDAGLVIAVGDEGSVWRGDASGVTLATTLSAELHGAFVSPSGDHAAVVGDDGLLVLSDDRGDTWDFAAEGVEADLYAVQIASDGSLVLAVGDGGTLLRVDAGQPHESTIVATDLRALHVDAQGQGAIVGLGGTFLVTDDAARTFTVHEVGSAADLLGVDALGHVHL
jgi:photosystem II stability/assembly factor-like uncharacterized protein